MDNNEKIGFVAESLAIAIDKQSNEFRNDNAKLFKEIIDKQDYKKYSELMKDAIKGSVKAMGEWEKTAFEELDGQTPEQYFAGIKTIDDAVGLTAVMIDKNENLFPTSFTESIKKLGESFENDILKKIEAIMPDETGKLTREQKAELMVAEIMAPEKFLDPLSRFLFRLDVNSADEETVDIIMDGLKSIGEASIPCLIAICEKIGHRGVIYSHSIITLAEIASEHKTEEIFRYLKECFRKSDMKVIEASALDIYGDGRAVAAIRSYVERNISAIGETEYYCYRDIILKFGGMVVDLDSMFKAGHR